MRETESCSRTLENARGSSSVSWVWLIWMGSRGCGEKPTSSQGSSVSAQMPVSRRVSASSGGKGRAQSNAVQASWVEAPWVYELTSCMDLASNRGPFACFYFLFLFSSFINIFLQPLLLTVTTILVARGVGVEGVRAPEGPGNKGTR